MPRRRHIQPHTTAENEAQQRSDGELLWARLDEGAPHTRSVWGARSVWGTKLLTTNLYQTNSGLAITSVQMIIKSLSFKP